jgi:NAD(P)-dependent dehydrogenase (short-subunit alcohol dehydrogenase family)
MAAPKTAVVTGASAGIGAELAVLLARDGFDLVLVNRSRASSADILARLGRDSPAASVEVVEADLADGNEVRAAAEAVARRAPRLDILFNNAGVLLGEKRMSKHGVEMHAQVNLLASYMLTRLLAEPLAAAGDGRVVNVSSGVVFMTGRLKVEDLRDPARFRRLVGPYGQSKLAVTTMTNALAPEYAERGVALRSVDPGGNRTKMTAGGGMPWPLNYFNVFFKGPETGARLIRDAALDPGLGTRGGIFLSGGRVKDPPRDANDPAVQARLLALCRELTGV